MRYIKFSVLIAALFAATGCMDDDGVSPEKDSGPMALVRFINAVPDTGTVDLRFVDRVENLPSLQGVGFQASSGMYQRVIPGKRTARIFPFSTNIALTQTRLVDTEVNLQGNQRYTLLYAGRAAAGAPEAERHRLMVIDELTTPPTPGDGQIGIQVLHAGVGLGNVDLYVVSVPTDSAPTPADWATNNVRVFSNIGYLTKTEYVNLPVTTELYRFVVTAAGSGTPIFNWTPNQPGIPAGAGQSYGAQPGVRISGSVMTAVIVNGSTVGTRQSTAANRVPKVFLTPDKVLN